MSEGARICTTPSSATATSDCRGQVLISGSYGGEYNAYHAAKWGLRGVILNDAGVGKNRAGIRGLDYLDTVQLAAAAADVNTCHIGDGDHMLAFGTISWVNVAAARLGCTPGEPVRRCAQRMCLGAPVNAQMPAVGGGKRFVIGSAAGEPPVIGLDAAPMLEPGDAGSIAITGSHAALFRGKPDGLIGPDVRAIFFSDAGIGLDEAGISRLPTLDARGIPAGAASSDSAEIGDARSIYETGVMSRVNSAAAALGARRGMDIKSFVASLLVRWRVGH